MMFAAGREPPVQKNDQLAPLVQPACRTDRAQGQVDLEARREKGRQAARPAFRRKGLDDGIPGRSEGFVGTRRRSGRWRSPASQNQDAYAEGEAAHPWRISRRAVNPAPKIADRPATVNSPGRAGPVRNKPGLTAGPGRYESWWNLAVRSP